MDNRISQTLSSEKRELIESKIDDVKKELDFLVGLTTDERKSMIKINRTNKLFVDDAILTSKENSTILPSYINIEEMEKDYELYQQLDNIALSLAQLAEKVSDTRILAGSEAMSSALMVYRMFQYAAKSGMPGANTIYDRLRVRFSKQVQGAEAGTDNNENETD